MKRLGVIADDFTGATDIAGFLVASGLRTIQLNGVPSARMAVEADAVVISLKSRSAPVEEAVADSLAALGWLREAGCEQFYFKYCSTFDSTPKGNIGPVTDALMGALGERFTVVCPALPVNGRTIYQGYLFVDGVPLAESGMRHHPVNPMTDSNLMRVMEAQSSGRCGLVPARTVEAGAAAVRTALEDLAGRSMRYAVLDALETTHLLVLGEAVKDMKLLTGGSGLAYGLARQWPSSAREVEAAAAGNPRGGQRVVLSGSCSRATNAQVQVYRHAAATFEVDVARALADEDYADEIADWASKHMGERYAPLVTATSGPDALAATQQRFGAETASHGVEALFGRLAERLAARGVDVFIVAGGETSGIVTQSLRVSGFHIGPEIAPGVPWVRAIDKPISLALKSGNFGSERFFFEAQDMIA